MILLPNFIIPLVAVIMFAFALYVLADVNPSAAPLVSIVTLVNIVTVCAMFNALKAGTALAYILAAGTFCLAAFQNKDSLKDKINGFFTPGVVLFVAASMAMLVCLAHTQPLIHQWDEYSFWAKSRQLVKNHNQLYTYYKSSMLGQSIPPALPLTSYFFQRFCPDFVEWGVYFAYDVLFFACFSAFCGNFDRNKSGRAAAMFVSALLIPYFFGITAHTTSLSSIYISAYSDLPLAVLTAGTVAVYMFSGRSDEKRIIPVLSCLVYLTFTKDMGFALGCIALFIIFFDIVVSKKEYIFFKIKGFIGKIATGFAMLAVTAATFLGWSRHLAAVLSLDRTDYGGEAGMGMVEILLNGVKEFLIGPKSEKFVIMQDKFFSAFFNTKVSMIGSGLIVVAVIAVIFLAAVIFGDKNSRVRSAVMGVTSLIGFGGYYIFHLLLYVYVLSGEAYSLASYERYIGTYYTAWLFMALMCLAFATVNSKLANGVLTGFMCCIVLVFGYYIRPENIFTGVNRQSFATRRSVMKKVEKIAPAGSNDDVIFILCGGDEGERWFTYTFEMDKNFIIPNADFTSAGENDAETTVLRRQEMKDRFEKYGVTHVLIDHSSLDFIHYFADMFNDSDVYAPMSDVGPTMVSYYKVNYAEDGMSFDFVEGGVVDFD